MKKILVVTLILTMVTLMFAGCQSSDKETKSGDNTGVSNEKTNDEEKPFRVAYIARAQADSFAAWLANAVMEEADKYDNIKVDVFDGQASDDTENSLIENAITNKYDAVIIQPNNGEAQRPYAEKAVKAGIITITTNARIDGIEGASSVDADPYLQAAVNAQAAIDQIPENANVVVLKGLPCR